MIFFDFNIIGTSIDIPLIKDFIFFVVLRRNIINIEIMNLDVNFF